MLLTIFLAIVFCAAITLMLLSAVAFIQNEKFFMAINYLKSGYYNVSMVAHMLGYDSVYHFSAQFKKKTGKTPEIWRVDPQWDGMEMLKLIIEVVVSAILAFIFIKVV